MGLKCGVVVWVCRCVPATPDFRDVSQTPKGRAWVENFTTGWMSWGLWALAV